MIIVQLKVKASFLGSCQSFYGLTLGNSQFSPLLRNLPDHRFLDLRNALRLLLDGRSHERVLDVGKETGLVLLQKPNLFFPIF